MNTQRVKLPDLSWVVSMYRTSEFVEPLCVRAMETACALNLFCEIVLVDDACPEGSAALAERLTGIYPIRLHRLIRNQGQDVALRAGVRMCRGQWAFILDGDLQDPPEALAALWPLRSQYDAVFADRVGAYESHARLLSSRLYRRSMELVGGLPRGAGLFVLLNRRLVDTIACTHRSRVFILAVLAAARGRYISVRVPRRSRPNGTSSYSFGGRWRKGTMSLCQTIAARHLGMSL
jgi:polyisoprenyl-phosphate glycosyltransferase